MKSSWAHKNGIKQSNEARAKEAPLLGWIKVGEFRYRYAERSRYDKSKLVVKTYANKKQAVKKMDEIKSTGIDCWLSIKHPFTIESSNVKGELI